MFISQQPIQSIMRGIVTGASGFIGSNLVLELEKQGHEVIAIINPNNKDLDNLKDFKGQRIVEDIRTINWSQFDVDAVFHQGAITDTTVTDEQLMMDVNLEASRKLLDFCTQKKIPFIYASSAATYGKASSPQKEQDAGNPTNVYGLSKWKLDCLAKEYMQKHDSLIVGLRYFNVFGPRENFKNKMASMIYQLAVKMHNGEQPRIFKWGEQARDQVYIKDVIRANLLALQAKKSCVVNIGSGNATSFNHIIDQLNKNMGTDFKPEYFDNPYDFYQERTEADVTLAKEMLGYEPGWNFDDAVADYIAFLGWKN